MAERGGFRRVGGGAVYPVAMGAAGAGLAGSASGAGAARRGHGGQLQFSWRSRRNGELPVQSGNLNLPPGIVIERVSPAKITVRLGPFKLTHYPKFRLGALRLTLVRQTILRGGRRLSGCGCVSLQCYNLAVMPCAESDCLKEDWEKKSRVEDSLYASGYGRSIKAGLENRRVATSERASAETRWMNHIMTCSVCQGEGKEAWEVDDRPTTC